jgi:hypothetical protein
MMQEYAFISNERERALKSKSGEEEEDVEVVELPSFDDPTKTIKYKKYKDISTVISEIK